MKKIITILLIITITTVMGYTEARNALLIANGKYTNFAGLKNPIPEANDLAKSLKSLGFNVTVKTDLSREEMADALYDFQQKVQEEGGIAFFHYGGHAVQVKGINYLIPANADVPDERRVDTRCLNLDEVMFSMSGDTNIVILDACRNNPLPAVSGRSASRGLVPVANKPKNSIIVYSAQAGSTAQDGVFTPLLTKKILEQKSFTQILRDIRVAVKEQTDNQQNPGSYDDSDTEIFLAGRPTVVVAANDGGNEQNTYHADNPNQPAVKVSAWYMGNYDKHKPLYASLVGIGTALGCGAAAMIPVGAVNLVDCANINLQQGITISSVILGVGGGLAAIALIMLPSVSAVWYKDANINVGIRGQIKNYQSKRMSRNQRMFAGLSVTTITAGYDCEKDILTLGMGVKL